METRAAVTESKGAPFAIQEIALGELRADGVLVRVSAAGICHTDLIVRDQWRPVPMPVVLGHEGAGVVEAVGKAILKVAPGGRVAMSYGSCGMCANCEAARPWVCHEFPVRNFGGTRPDGSTALSRGGQPITRISSVSRASRRTRSRLSATSPRWTHQYAGGRGARLVAGVQTGAGTVLNALRPEAGTSIAIFGTGSVGLAAVMAARVAGCTTIIGIDVQPARLIRAEELGATVVVNGNSVDAVKRSSTQPPVWAWTSASTRRDLRGSWPKRSTAQPAAAPAR